MDMTLDHLRGYAVTRSLLAPTTLRRALDRLGFVQADPIRAPARAQDLTLRHRVRNYRAGDLERKYTSLGVHEDVFVNYGFVTSDVQALMHPRSKTGRWPGGRQQTAEILLAFVRERGEAHPREVDEHFSHGTVVNYWGGSSSATTHMLDAMHYRGWLRVTRRDNGIRVYAAHDHPLAPTDRLLHRTRVDALVDVAVRKYAPLPARTLSSLVSRLRYAVPQWQADLRPAFARAHARLSHVRIDGTTWYWPADEPIGPPGAGDTVRLLAPFDPVVWDRRRFELFWGWAYRFEAYTPVSKRKLGYYALPLLWRDMVIGWGNIAVREGELHADIGYVSGRPPAGRAFRTALDEELERMRTFLRLSPAP